ncbi:MAG: J domain-containing protein [Kofleriaceae bacterium]|nr:J domain-containing protein [Kofleriaceae bacterium]
MIGRKGQPAHVILEVRADATPEQAQEAFHKIARTCHPDLHRNGLNAEELELVTSAYAAVAGAYHVLRSQSMQTTRMRTIKSDGSMPPQQVGPMGVSSNVPATPSGAAPSGNASQSMSSKALVYYRKAELSLKRGDLKGALLQLKLAIAADPGSAFLRTALAEVELELRKGT